jgi:hypothetical protein
MRTLKLFGLLLFASIVVGGCDEIDPPYMKVLPPPIDTTECPIPTFPADTHHVKVVLLEDYTGHNCVNCPTAAEIAHNIQATYGEEVVLMAVHAGFFAVPHSGNYTLDLRTAVGESLYAHFGITNNPAAMFNRKYIGGARIFEAYSGWETDFLQVQDTIPVLDMQIINDFTESESKVCIHIQTEYLTDMDRHLKLAVYVTEDSIIGYQDNNNIALGPNPIPDYVFMHVLRGAVNSTWGDDLSTTEITAGTKLISNFKLILDSGWDHDNCHIVAFVYDADTEEILQAAEEKVEQ